MKTDRSIPLWLVMLFVAVFLGLSGWQFYRLVWKESLITERQDKLTMPPLTWPIVAQSVPDLSFRRSQLTGRFDHSHEMYLVAGSRQGESGFNVLVPFYLENGLAIIVNRGWVPAHKKDPATRSAGMTSGLIIIEGILRPGMQQGLFVPNNIPANNTWVWVDLPTMINYAQIPHYIPYLLYMDIDDKAVPGGFPVGGQTPLELPNNHLEYALTWLLLALLISLLYYFHPYLNKPK
jgi:surfeit locus 1 family protein